MEIALRGVTTPLAVTERRRLPAKVRQAAEDLGATMTRTVREVESTASAALGLAQQVLRKRLRSNPAGPVPTQLLGHGRGFSRSATSSIGWR